MTQRQTEKIYRAESVVASSRILSPLATRAASVRRLRKEVRAILNDPTLGRYYPMAAEISRTIRVTDGRGHKCAMAFAETGKPYTIALPRRFRSHWNVCHEIAHVLTGVNGHGADYAGALWLLVTLFLDPALGQRLDAEFRDKGIVINKPRPKRES